MTLNGITFNFDLFDATVAEKYDASLKEMATLSKFYEDVKDGKLDYHQAVRSSCELIFKQLDNLLGKGAHNKIFGKEVNYLECHKVWQQLQQQAGADMEKKVKELNAG